MKNLSYLWLISIKSEKLENLIYEWYKNHIFREVLFPMKFADIYKTHGIRYTYYKKINICISKKKGYIFTRIHYPDIQIFYYSCWI